MNRRERTQAFVTAIWEWYSVHKRTLPWRDLPDTDPVARAYKVLVSEIMLQQTQVPRVIVKYGEFLERFPTIEDLAGASSKEVLIAWRGMGYNRRALRLRDAAASIVGVSNDSLLRNFVEPSARIRSNEVTKTRSAFPTSIDDLTSIPGIGRYTAAAIRNFAFGIPTPCLDTNIRRILHRTFVGPENADGSWSKDDEYLLQLADEVLEEATKGTKETKVSLKKSSVASVPFVPFVASDWHAALMDFGALVHTKRNPKWEMCPLTKKGIMKTTKKNYELRMMNYGNRKGDSKKSEPGRHVGSTFIPNRIFRGRVIEALRDAPTGLTLHGIGKQVAIDWDPGEHREWLQIILKQLTREAMLGVRRGRYMLG